MYRLELNYLISWAQGKKHKPLVIRGARQVGKSTLVRLFAQQAGLNLVELNFERNPGHADLFESNVPTEIIKLISLQYTQPIEAGKTLLFLDEIQAVPGLLQVLRYFYEDMPELHVIAAGSLLEFTLKEAKFSMPVGRIEYMHLGPVSFEGFLLAMGEQSLYEFLQTYRLGESYPISIHQKFMRLLKTYLIIGGMPEAIDEYVHHQNFMASEKVKHSILNTYVDDFSKYSSGSELERLRNIFIKLPSLIGTKFKYTKIDPDIKSTVIANSLAKLALARVAYCVYHTAANGVPLGVEINEKIFKVLFLDVGLASTRLGLSVLDLQDDQEIFLINSGAIAEQFVGQQLLYMKPPYETPELYYWVREKKSSLAEVDYVISKNQRVIPIEVKAGKSGVLKSLHSFVDQKSCQLAVRLNACFPENKYKRHELTTGGKVEYNLLSLPLYFVNQLYRFIEGVSDTQRG